MSRIGKMPIAVPSGVDVTVEGATIKVKGSKGELSRTLSDRVSIDLADGTLTVNRVDDSREARALHGLTAPWCSTWSPVSRRVTPSPSRSRVSAIAPP